MLDGQPVSVHVLAVLHQESVHSQQLPQVTSSMTRRIDELGRRQVSRLQRERERGGGGKAYNVHEEDSDLAVGIPVLDGVLQRFGKRRVHLVEVLHVPEYNFHLKNQKDISYNKRNLKNRKIEK